MLATAMVLVSSAFAPGGEIPVSASCRGAGRSPALTWSHVPAGSRAFAIVLDDPDANPGGAPFVHWLGWNIPGGARRLATGSRAPREGLNGAGTLGYTGPCPPSGRHHYRFRLYALSAPLALAAGADRTDLVRALQGRVRGSALLVGRFRAG
jgi:Raf kinase inhibitor-like YbhB/YbcL family protein